MKRGKGKDRTKGPYFSITPKPIICSKENNKSKTKSLLGKKMEERRV